MLRVGLIYNLKRSNPNNGDKTPRGSIKNMPQRAKAAADKDKHAEDRYLEWDEPGTIKEIKRTLSENCDVILIEADKNLWSKLRKFKKELDLVFNIAEGLNGAWREAMVPLFLEELGIPYTGSDPATLVLCLNKERTKQILGYHKIKCPSYKVFSEVPEFTEDEISPLEFPLIVKPIWEGSSKGIKSSSLVMDLKQCQNEIARVIQMYREPVLVEEFIPGKEFTVGVLGNGEDLLVLPIVALNFSSLPKGAAPIYSYEAKWVWDVPQAPLSIFHCPAKVAVNVEKRIKETAINAYNALGCRDWCRIDIRLDKQDRPYVLELNPIPGILPDPRSNSCLPKAARAYGWSYSQLINTVLAITCKRYGIRYERAYSYSI